MTIAKLFDRTDRERTSQLAPFGRATSLSSRIVADVRDALFEGRLKPDDFLGGEKDIAARFGVSRMAARDAMRTLQALGIVEIKMGKGGGVRITRGNPRLLAEALAVQLELVGVEPSEIVDAQRAVECVAAELAAENATAADIKRLRELVADSAGKTHDIVAFTDSTREFHLAIAEASHNRVLVVQLLSLQHVTWPKRNMTQTLSVANKIMRVHRELVDLIAARDAAGARQLMDDHVKMIRTRRPNVKNSGPRDASGSAQQSCC